MRQSFRVLFVTFAAVGGGLVGFYYQDKAKQRMIEQYMSSLSNEELVRGLDIRHKDQSHSADGSRGSSERA
ncbi:hypothetical protein BCR44DRAFT_42563 [Catenaria anguillulae PL171]|uniref:Uncharacterized protein n=1 Tax=Catenaria anguillulae PL171 TaxID=765915 RepID=A0A1Y2HKE7_9FUNG|nr:hypothetical protein BCR44DRAFT_42563 [Catenaria anguillulae PL171]